MPFKTRGLLSLKAVLLRRQKEGQWIAKAIQIQQSFSMLRMVDFKNFGKTSRVEK